MCGALCSTCEFGADSLRNFDISLIFDQSSSSGGPQTARSETRCELGTLSRSSTQNTVVEAVTKLPWTWLNDSLEMAGKRRHRLRADCAVNLQVVDATQANLLDDDRVRSYIQKSLSRVAQDSLQFV